MNGEQDACSFNQVNYAGLRNLTPGLQEAMKACNGAVDGRGLRIFLAYCLDPEEVANRCAVLLNHALDPQATYLHVDLVTPSPDGAALRANALENAMLLLRLLREHVLAGNFPCQA